MVPEDSMNNPLCHSAVGSMVTFDYCTPDTVWRGGERSSSARAKTQHVSEHAERVRGYHVGQHVNSQVLDVTMASHCTGSVSSALASGGAGRRGPDTGPDKRGVHSSTNQYLRGVSRSR